MVVQVFQAVQVVSVVRMISLDDLHSENIWFSWFRPSNYREKYRCHACNGRMDERKESGKKCSILEEQKPQKVTWEECHIADTWILPAPPPELIAQSK